MKKCIIDRLISFHCLMLIAFGTITIHTTTNEDTTIVDSIIAIIYHVEGNEPILKSDLSAGLDGKIVTAEELILERLMFFEAKRYKIQVTDQELDRFIAQILQRSGWVLNDLIQFLESHGYSYEEGKELLKRKHMVNQLIDYKIRSHRDMVITKEEVANYYEKHPHFEEATFTLQIAYVPQQEHSSTTVQNMIKNKNDPFLDSLNWDEPFILKKSELADDRQFIHHKNKGAIVLQEAVEDGIELTRLIDKTPEKKIPFDQIPYQEIFTELMQKKFETVLKKYKDELLSKAYIVYL